MATNLPLMANAQTCEADGTTTRSRATEASFQKKGWIKMIHPFPRNTHGRGGGEVAGLVEHGSGNRGRQLTAAGRAVLSKMGAG